MKHWRAVSLPALEADVDHSGRFPAAHSKRQGCIILSPDLSEEAGCKFVGKLQKRLLSKADEGQRKAHRCPQEKNTAKAILLC